MQSGRKTDRFRYEPRGGFMPTRYDRKAACAPSVPDDSLQAVHLQTRNALAVKDYSFGGFPFRPGYGKAASKLRSTDENRTSNCAFYYFSS
jgi:hypothetical protein